MKVADNKKRSSGIALMSMSFRLHPLLMFVMLAANFATGPLAALSTRYMGDLVNEASAAFGTAALSRVFEVLLFAAGAAIASALSYVVALACEGKIRIGIEKNVQSSIMRIASRTDYLDFISEDFQKEMNAAQEGFGAELLGSFGAPFDAIASAVSLVSYLALVTETAGFIAIIAAALTIAAACAIKLRSLREAFSLFRQNRKLRLQMDYMNSLYTDTGVYAEMKLFGTKGKLDERYGDFHTRYEKQQLDVNVKNTRHAFLMALVMGMVTFASITLCFATGRVADAGALTVIAMSFAVLLSKSTRLAFSITSINSLAMHAKSYLDFKAKYESASDAYEPPARINRSAAIDMQGLTFAYGDLKVLKGVDMRVEPGRMVALVGENGCGKTTLANIILGLFKKGGGTAEVFGRDAYHARRCGACDSVAVFQQFGKYGGHTVGENIAFGENVDMAKLRMLDGYMSSLDMEATVGNEFDGRDFSGGEWQKLVLARCMASDAPLIVLDEPTAALDPMAEAEAFERFMRANRGKTAVLITHRLGAVRNADAIFVLKDGVVKEHGTHDELMGRRGYYADMFNAQAQWYVRDDTKGGGGA